MGITYTETFDNGPGGWQGRRAALEVRDSVAISRSPWWVDANHAPPGGGYLHLPFILFTRGRFTDPDWVEYSRPGGLNRFIKDNYPTDFTNAKMTVKIKGELEARGARLVLLAQANLENTTANHILTAQPFQVTKQWTSQSITLVPDPKQWLCIGTRNDLKEKYGYSEFAPVLRNINYDIILVLHPLDVVPAHPIKGDPHVLWAGKDYEVDYSRLPEGYIMLDEVRIDF